MYGITRDTTPPGDQRILAHWLIKFGNGIQKDRDVELGVGAKF